VTAAGILAVAVVLLGRASSDDAPRPLATDVAQGAPSVTPEAPPVRATNAAPAVRAAEAGAETDSDRRARITRAIDGAKAQVVEAATPCWRAHAGDHPVTAPGFRPDETTGTLRLRYRLVMVGDEAHLEEVTVLDATDVPESLAKCIAERAAAARWPSDDPAGVVAIEELLPIGDLTGSTPLPPRTP